MHCAYNRGNWRSMGRPISSGGRPTADVMIVKIRKSPKCIDISRQRKPKNVSKPKNDLFIAPPLTTVRAKNLQFSL